MLRVAARDKRHILYIVSTLLPGGSHLLSRKQALAGDSSIMSVGSTPHLAHLVLDRICYFVADGHRPGSCTATRQDLFNMCNVDKAFHTAGTPHLYHTIGSKDIATELLRTLQKTNDAGTCYGKYVRKIHIANYTELSGTSYELWNETAMNILELLPDVHHIGLTRIRDNKRLGLALTKFANLITLDLCLRFTNERFLTPSDLADMFDQLPHLTSVGLERLRCWNAPDFPLVLRSLSRLPHLERLTVLFETGTEELLPLLEKQTLKRLHCVRVRRSKSEVEQNTLWNAAFQASQQLRIINIRWH